LWVSELTGLKKIITPTSWLKGGLYQFAEPETAPGICERNAKRALRVRVCREHQEYWQSIAGQRHAESFLSEPSAKRIVAVLKLNTKYTNRHVNMTLLLKGRPFQTGYSNRPYLWKVPIEIQIASFTLCDCEGPTEGIPTLT
jgi:hypothetical protein